MITLKDLLRRYAAICELLDGLTREERLKLLKAAFVMADYPDEAMNEHLPPRQSKLGLSIKAH